MWSLKPTAKGSTRSQIDIESVSNHTLRLSRNRYCKILSVNSINFELKSEDEQDAIIDTFEGFLNSLGFPLQILMRTREVDLDNYLHELGERLKGETEHIYQEQLAHYQSFIQGLVKHNKILTRQFYVVVGYQASDKTDASLVAEQLALRVDIVTKGLSRLGIHAKELPDLAILDLFYSFYNPVQAKRQPLTDRTLQAVHSNFVSREVRL